MKKTMWECDKCGCAFNNTEAVVTAETDLIKLSTDFGNYINRFRGV